MKLWCAKCHTLWLEQMLMPNGKCLWKDCDGRLTADQPLAPQPPREPKPKPTFPLLEDSK